MNQVEEELFFITLETELCLDKRRKKFLEEPTVYFMFNFVFEGLVKTKDLEFP